LISYRDRPTHHIALLGLAVGAAYALTIVLTLELCVALYQPAEFSTFNSVAVLAGITGLIGFSNPRRHAVGNASMMVHDFGTIMRVWLGVFFLALFSLYLTKSAADFSRVVMTMWLFAVPISLALTSLLCRWWVLRLYAAHGRRRTAVFVGFSEDAQRLSESFRDAEMLGVITLGYFDNRLTTRRADTGLLRLGNLMDASVWFENNPVDIVFISLAHVCSKDIARVVDALCDSVVSVYFVPESSLFGLGRMQYGDIAGTPVMVAYETPFIGVTQLLKRFVDVILSSLILLLLSPLLLCIAVGVKLSSPGPVLFRQMRYGVGGQRIEVFKFRSMRHDSLPQGGEVRQATVGDTRITPFGRLLRKTSLDELPQFFNVLSGSMSIVGPRPHAVQHNELYRKKVKGYMLRHKVRPGITGWAQIHGLRGETDTLDKMRRRIEYDLHYIRNWSLALDIEIILRTVPVVFKDRNAY
jgi:putative colanic acid biosynthesis UDP-glucose lipid carrier transferase